MSVQSSDGIFTFRVSSASGVYGPTHNRIPAQTMILKSVRAEFDTTANALSCQALYVDFPWLNSNHLIDSLANLYSLVVPVDNLVCTLYTCEIPVQMSTEITESFNYRIVNSSGAAPTGFVGLILQFSYDSSII